MGVSFLLCLVPALLATASAEVIKCVWCRGSAAECQDRTRTCRVDPDTGGCISTVEVNTLGGIPVTGYVKGCLPDYYSGIMEPVSFTVGERLYLRVNNVRCRNGDKCNSGPVEPPQENSTLNGRQCPACLAFGAQTCTSRIIRCTGEETYCGDFAGTLQRGSSGGAMFAAQGCVTPSARGIGVVYGLVSGIHTFYFDHASVRAAELVPSPGASTQPRNQHLAPELVPSPGASIEPRSQHPALEPAPSPGASPQPRSQHPAPEPAPSPGASTQPRSQHPATEPAPSPRASTQPRSQYPATEPVPSHGASTQPRSQYPAPEPVPSHGASTQPRSQYPATEETWLWG